MFLERRFRCFKSCLPILPLRLDTELRDGKVHNRLEGKAAGWNVCFVKVLWSYRRIFGEKAGTNVEMTQRVVVPWVSLTLPLKREQFDLFLIWGRFHSEAI